MKRNGFEIFFCLIGFFVCFAIVLSTFYEDALCLNFTGHKICYGVHWEKIADRTKDPK